MSRTCTLLLLLVTLAARAEGIPLELCTGLGCSSRQVIRLTEEELGRLDGLFLPPASTPGEERARIRRAVALLERLAGRQSPIRLDRGGNPDSVTGGDAPPAPPTSWPPALLLRRHPDVRGQLDCVAESANTTTFLRLLQRRGLLRWHEVLQPAFRAPRVFDQHWAAQIREKASGHLYVVDSWYLDNGQPPYIQPLADWRRKAPLPE